MSIDEQRRLKPKKDDTTNTVSLANNQNSNETGIEDNTIEKLWYFELLFIPI